MADHVKPSACDSDEDVVNNNRLTCSKNACKGVTARHYGICRLCQRSADVQERAEAAVQQKPKVNNGFYLSVILGNNIDLTLRSSKARYDFKRDYENFKLRVTSILLVLLIVALLFPSRVIDAVCNFLSVWYYCTLTIRESILRINGSRIQAWWVAHHYLACVLAGVALTWPDDVCYKEFRSQFILFAGCIALVQQVQYQYQKGCLRRLVSLGQNDTMDVTLEGFESWMFKGLTFLLPILFGVYLFEFYNSYALFQLWLRHGCEGAWQVIALSIIFSVVAVGNAIAVTVVMLKKWAPVGPNAAQLYALLESKYPSMYKLH